MAKGRYRVGMESTGVGEPTVVLPRLRGYVCRTRPNSAAWATKIRLDGSSSLRCSMVQGGHLPKAGVYLPHAKSRVVGCRPAVEGADMQHAGHRLVPVE
jgi:hypothetical protein